jgi:hypothetical protein
MDARNERVAEFSDEGECVDVYARGEDVHVDGRVVNGTSFAAPLVSGLAAAWVGYCMDKKECGELSAERVKQQILKSADRKDGVLVATKIGVTSGASRLVW